MKLLITGGHVTPALACIDYIAEKKLPLDIVFVGRQFAQKDDTEPTYEYKEITSRNIPFHHLTTGRLTRSVSLQTLKHLLDIPKGFWNAYKLLKEIRPDKILSFGGYLAVPIAVIGSLMNIPVYTHEQTIHPGLANKIIGHFAKNIFVSFPETVTYFSAEKVIVTGNPIRQSIFATENPQAEKINIAADRPVMYVTGGSLGAHAINVHIEKILPQLLEKYTVIHQSGNVAEFGDYERLKQLRDSFTGEMQEHYHLYTHLFADQIGYVYSKADLVISRSGANTFSELAALQKPTIFIPLPISAHGEQQKHAELFTQYGVGEVFDQKGSSEELLQLVDKMISNLSHYKDNFKKFPSVYVQQAAQSIVDTIYKS